MRLIPIQLHDLAVRLLYPQGEMAQEEYDRALAIEEEGEVEDDDGSREQS